MGNVQVLLSLPETMLEIISNIQGAKHVPASHRHQGASNWNRIRWRSRAPSPTLHAQISCVHQKKALSSDQSRTVPMCGGKYWPDVGGLFSTVQRRGSIFGAGQHRSALASTYQRCYIDGVQKIKIKTGQEQILSVQPRARLFGTKFVFTGLRIH